MYINTFVLMKPPYVFQFLFGSDIRLVNYSAINDRASGNTK